MSDNDDIKVKGNIKQKMAYHPLLLGGIALVAGTLLVLADINTHHEIVNQEARDLRNSINQVVDAKVHDNKLLDDTIVLHYPLEFNDSKKGITFYRARYQGKVVAVAYQIIGMGFGGPIHIMMSVRDDGTIMGVRVISHSETPGLGDKIEADKSNWIKSFTGMSLTNHTAAQWHVKKDGGVFDQFSGATITPRAVVRAVHAGLMYFNAHRAKILGQEASHG